MHLDATKPMTAIVSRAAVSVLLLVAATSPLGAQTAQTAPTDSTPRISVGAFVDTYFAWDAGRPPSVDRSFAGGTPFTTQPARHNEFNINLAFVEVKLDAPSYRGRLALQTGTSVQSNYAGEPTQGSASGPSLARTIQEAVVGVKLADQLWVDGGIFYSHMGMESWASRDNLTYTRSLVAEYSPYYSSGVKLSYTPTSQLTAQLHVVNGWQNISENNSGKGAGVRLDYAATPSIALSYYNFFSNEAGNRLRTFNGVGVKQVAGALTVLGQIDVGTQSRGENESSATWFGWTAVGRVQATPSVALVARVEGYRDRDQVIIATGTFGDASNPAFNALGGSVGIDVSRFSRVGWRSELRGWRNDRALFPDGGGAQARTTSLMAVSSLSLSF